jgi:RNA polymerase sigma-70 factor (ECF subfamily)
MAADPDPDGPDDPAADRDLLLGVAFRLLGSHADASDAVQEAYRRWLALAPPARAAIVSPTAWLVTVVSRICLDELKSARVRRERYVGPWLPEPLPSTVPTSGRHHAVDPAEHVTLDESVTTAMLIVLDAMTPAERVAFVLHDVFGYAYADIATIVGRTPTACRQLASTGRRKARTARDTMGNRDDHRRAVAALKAAWEARDIGRIVRLLDPDVLAMVDGGGEVSAPTAPIVGGRAVADLLDGVRQLVPDLVIDIEEVNARPGLVVRDADGRVLAVLSVAVAHERIVDLYVTRNPTKLSAWT